MSAAISLKAGPPRLAGMVQPPRPAHAQESIHAA